MEKWSKHSPNGQKQRICVCSFPLTGAAEGPAPAVEVYQTPPQPSVPSSQRLVHTHGDSTEGDITDSDPGRGLYCLGLWPGKAFHRLPHGVDVMAHAQPGLDRGLRTDGLLSCHFDFIQIQIEKGKTRERKHQYLLASLAVSSPGCQCHFSPMTNRTKVNTKGWKNR